MSKLPLGLDEPPVVPSYREVPKWVCPGLPPRGLTRKGAAAYLNMTAVQFDEFVAAGNGVSKFDLPSHDLYDRFSLDAALGTIYVVQVIGFVKIGWTRNAPQRWQVLQAGVPDTLHLIATFVGTRHDENMLHVKFAPHHSRGEWFRREGELDSWIKEGCPL